MILEELELSSDEDEVLTSTDISSLTDEDDFASDKDDMTSCDEENKKMDLERDAGNKKDTNDGMESKYDSESTDSELEERRMRKRSLRREFELEGKICDGPL